MALIFTNAFDFLSGLNEVLDNAKRSFGVTQPTEITVIDTNGKSITMVVDCSLSLNTDQQMQIPGFPVEVGFDLSDNAIAKPLRFRLNGLISETELTPFTNVVTGIIAKQVADQVPPHLGLSDSFVNQAISAGIKLTFAGVQDIVGDAVAAIFDIFGTTGVIEDTLGKRGTYTDIDYPKRAMQALKLIAQDAMPVKITTYFDEESYNNMLIQSISFTQNAETPDALVFTMDCVQIRTVETKKLDAITNLFAKITEGNVVDPAGTSAAPEKPKGTKTGKSTSLIYGGVAGKGN